MAETLRSKVVNFLKLVAFIIAAFVIAYLLVKTAHFLPNGYLVENVTEQDATVLALNWFGEVEETINVSPPKDEVWIAVELIYSIERLAGVYMLLFFAIFTSIYVSMTKLRTTEKPIGFIVSMIIGIVGLIIPLIMQLNRISDLLEMINRW
ncbi:hypothetical protein BKP35_00835 [Anaerobacillus arseniciselenatis]|uniref:Uncharacterized protein n=1 Tax=Anaerobacillus arseniciselenatis TaxID=85682 RepID=A0A1S2LTV0_9BACI|nr:hypothetical protein [Anaerobacillus arseniciselenatis]OIJ15573.1 hypothetical protein BKP35_00835 [Anaerobacillus arseniciselenatis]